MDEPRLKRRGQEHSKVARFHGYRDFYLARKFRITLEEASTIIKRIGKDRVKGTPSPHARVGSRQWCHPRIG
jgi:hypothetical protein